MSLLDHRYGSPVQVAAGLVDNLLQYPIVKADDIEGLETFAIHLRGSMNALASLPNGSGSIDVKTIRLLLEKVPLFMRDKWRVKVDDIEHTDHRQAHFKDFVQFIERETRVLWTTLNHSQCNETYIYGKEGGFYLKRKTLSW